MYKLAITLVLVTVVISACTNMNTKESNLAHYNQSELKRAKELYACSNYFHIVGTQRKNEEEIERYKNLTAQSKKLGDILIAAADDDPKSLDIDLTNSLYKNGYKEAIEMVKAIGKDKTGTKFKETTISCYKVVQREDLFETVDVLNKRLNKDTDK